MNQHTGAGNFAEQERSRVEAELADLRRRRDQMRAELRDDADTVGDRGDAADAIQRAEDLAGIDEQIARLTWLLAGGNTDVSANLVAGLARTYRATREDEVTPWVTESMRQQPPRPLERPAVTLLVTPGRWRPWRAVRALVCLLVRTGMAMGARLLGYRNRRRNGESTARDLRFGVLSQKSPFARIRHAGEGVGNGGERGRRQRARRVRRGGNPS